MQFVPEKLYEQVGVNEDPISIPELAKWILCFTPLKRFDP
jgi:hypothetical protein